jgi:hypothetical protein
MSVVVDSVLFCLLPSWLVVMIFCTCVIFCCCIIFTCWLTFLQSQWLFCCCGCSCYTGRIILNGSSSNSMGGCEESWTRHRRHVYHVGQQRQPDAWYSLPRDTDHYFIRQLSVATSCRFVRLTNVALSADRPQARHEVRNGGCHIK